MKGGRERERKWTIREVRRSRGTESLHSYAPLRAAELSRRAAVFLRVHSRFARGIFH